MKRLPLLCLSLVACSAPADHYGFVAMLGKDTVSVERVTRRGNRIESDEVDRFPRVRLRHSEIELAEDGGIHRLEMTVRTPSEPSGQRERKVTVEVGRDSVRIEKRDSTGNKYWAFPVGNRMTMVHVPQMYSLYDVYFGAAARSAKSAGDSVTFNQVYIDREFDRFPLHHGVVTLRANGKAEIHHDWLSGIGEAVLDSAHHIISYSGARTTYKVDVKRVDDVGDVEALGQRYAAAESAGGGVKQLSVRDTTRASIGNAAMWLDYARPLARGRVLLGDVIPFDYVWRTGANAATQFNTSAPITLAGLHLQPGTYTLWTVPRKDGRAELIVNKQSGQWGTEYNSANDLGTGALRVDTLTTPTDKFTISIVPAGATRGSLVLEWGTFRWTAAIIRS
jgi:hypothetical protein